MCSITDHDREDDGHKGGFENPEDSQAGDLDESEEVDPPQGDMAEVGEVRLVLGGHQVELDPIPELSKKQETGELLRDPTNSFDSWWPSTYLDAAEGSHAHVEKDAVEHRHRDELQWSRTGCQCPTYRLDMSTYNLNSDYLLLPI